jgi:hypothetical protein
MCGLGREFLYAERNKDENHHPSEDAEQPVRPMTFFGNIEVFDHDVLLSPAVPQLETCAINPGCGVRAGPSPLKSILVGSTLVDRPAAVPAFPLIAGPAEGTLRACRGRLAIRALGLTVPLPRLAAIFNNDFLAAVHESVPGPKLPRWRTPAAAAFGGILLQNSKMRGRENFEICPSKWIFGDTMPCDELTKAAGWKSDCSRDPLHNFRTNAPAPLEKFARAPKKSFATQSDA